MGNHDMTAPAAALASAASTALRLRTGDAFGDHYLDALVAALADLLGAAYAFVGVLDPETADVRSLTAWPPGEPFRYALAGTPCEHVAGQGFCVFEQDVVAQFPADRLLIDMQVDGYAGVPLRLDDGPLGPLGLLVVLWRGRIPADAPVRELLEQAQPRASAEVERLLAIPALERSEHRYRTLVESSVDGIFVRRGFQLLYANSALARMLGYPDVATLLALPSVQPLIAPEDQPRLAGFVQQRQSATAPAEYEFSAMCRDGSRRAVHARVAEVCWEDGGLAWQAVLRDITAEREREALLREREKTEAIGQLTGGIAHDFNNLLAVVAGNLELVAAELGPGSGSLAEYVREAQRAARRGADLTRQLLAFARRQPLDPTAIDVPALVGEVVRMLRRTLSADIVIDTALHARRSVWADRTQLQMALLNLALNARDAMPEGGVLSILSHDIDVDDGGVAGLPDRSGPLVCVEVADSGHGMTEAVRQRAVEPFFTTKPIGGGTGLGLSQVHGFASQSRGALAIDSAPERGTRVRLYLPTASATARGAAPVEDPAPVGSGPGARVLLVEDDPAVRDVCARMLQGLGCTVTTASGGIEAMQTLRGDRFDCLVSDVVLGAGYRGPDIADFARTFVPDLPVLFISGYPEHEAFRAGRPPGSTLLNKPFTMTELGACLARLLP